MCLKDLRDEFISDCECRYGDCVFLTDSDIIKSALLLGLSGRTLLLWDML